MIFFFVLLDYVPCSISFSAFLSSLPCCTQFIFLRIFTTNATLSCLFTFLQDSERVVIGSRAISKYHAAVLGWGSAKYFNPGGGHSRLGGRSHSLLPSTNKSGVMSRTFRAALARRPLLLLLLELASAPLEGRGDLAEAFIHTFLPKEAILSAMDNVFQQHPRKAPRQAYTFKSVNYLAAFLGISKSQRFSSHRTNILKGRLGLPNHVQVPNPHWHEIQPEWTARSQLRRDALALSFSRTEWSTKVRQVRWHEIQQCSRPPEATNNNCRKINFGS
ncbi:hypothetical protein L218DRAFT_78304 [Marasmius fiardii PR-910]|nr:hypothetical protein L218DRAFT_78304 [Marasmius fiardii PR-910]